MCSWWKTRRTSSPASRMAARVFRSRSSYSVRGKGRLIRLAATPRACGPRDVAPGPPTPSDPLQPTGGRGRPRRPRRSALIGPGSVGIIDEAPRVDLDQGLLGGEALDDDP